MSSSSGQDSGYFALNVVMAAVRIISVSNRVSSREFVSAQRAEGIFREPLFDAVGVKAMSAAELHVSLSHVFQADGAHLCFILVTGGLALSCVLLHMLLFEWSPYPDGLVGDVDGDSLCAQPVFRVRSTKPPNALMKVLPPRPL